ncbi:MAG: GFA family protein [Caulobacteraceae bacterium]
MSKEAFAWRSGGCHCGAVRFETKLPAKVVAQSCNCSICAMTGFVHVIVPESRFRVIQGGDALTTYAFNTGVARHLFCANCGVKSFYPPPAPTPTAGRSTPDAWTERTALDIEIEAFDGQNWEANAPALADLSRDPA